MTNITIQCPEEVLISLKEDAESFKRHLTLAAAMKFYELGHLTSGRAADLAGISRVEFLHRAAEFEVRAWNLTERDMQEDLRNA